jgi:hypothetical protein
MSTQGNVPRMRLPRFSVGSSHRRGKYDQKRKSYVESTKYVPTGEYL